MSNQKQKTLGFEVNHARRAKRRSTPHTVQKNYIVGKPCGEELRCKREYESTPEEAEIKQILSEAVQII
jgi:hypothetical protein